MVPIIFVSRYKKINYVNRNININFYIKLQNKIYYFQQYYKNKYYFSIYYIINIKKNIIVNLNN